MRVRIVHIICLSVVLVLFSNLTYSQDGKLGKNDTVLVNAIVWQGDTIPAQTLDWVWVTGQLNVEQSRKKAEWTRLRNAVYVTYPYARRAGIIINDINSKLSNIPTKDKRKEYIKTREKELKKEFTEPLSDLSVYQGKVLMKLINRQTGNNCYELISEYKGSFTARFYQTIAFVFGSSLKQPYDASGDDRQIETIVMEVEKMYPPLYNRQ
jgi:hypothetical protein